MKYFDTCDDINFVLTNKSDFNIKKHNHVSKYVAGLVLRGSLTLTENNNTLTCSTDDLFIIPVYVTHNVRIIDPQTSFLSMCVGETFIANNCNLKPYTDKLCADKIITQSNAAAFTDALEIIISMHDTRNTSTLVDNMCKSIIRNPEENISLDDWSDKIYISKYYLVRKFRDEIGITPHNFLVQNRIRKAKQLLAEQHTETDVANECGFFDQSIL